MKTKMKTNFPTPELFIGYANLVLLQTAEQIAQIILHQAVCASYNPKEESSFSGEVIPSDDRWEEVSDKIVKIFSDNGWTLKFDVTKIQYGTNTKVVSYQLMPSTPKLRLVRD